MSDPALPPAKIEDGKPFPRHPPRHRDRGLILIGLILTASGAAMWGAVGVGAVPLMFLVPGILISIVGVRGQLPATARAPDLGDPRSKHSNTGAIVFVVIVIVIGAVVAVVWHAMSGWGDFMKLGRPLRVNGRQRLSRLARGGSWHDDAIPRLAGLGAWRRARLGVRWLTAARAEHASVPAFDRLAVQLAAVAAPGELIARCHAAARDEARHARRCFALARAYSGIAWTAGALPATAGEPVELSSIAVESLIDGCLGEAIAAELAHRGAVRAADPAIGASLAMIAEDEARHAELGWAVVAFCVERGGPGIARALAVAAAEPPGRASSGPIDLSRAEVAAVVAAQAVAVRARLGSLIAAA